jgi:hypothetical protein
VPFRKTRPCQQATMGNIIYCRDLDTNTVVSFWLDGVRTCIHKITTMLAERLGVDESVLSFRFYGPVNQNCVNYTYIVDIPTVTRVVISDETVSTPPAVAPCFPAEC